MHSKVILIAATAIAFSGCATVDLQTMAGSSGNSLSTTQYEKESNVVQRAVERLRDTFASLGFGASTSERKMQAAADMLLNGLSARHLVSDQGDYANLGKTTSEIIDDIQLARGHVEQTKRAAEIYLEVAPQDRDFEDELEGLEAALMASERAFKTFERALEDETQGELVMFQTSVDSLRGITDEFGARVRATKTSKSDAQSTS